MATPTTGATPGQTKAATNQTATPTAQAPTYDLNNPAIQATLEQNLGVPTTGGILNQKNITQDQVGQALNAKLQDMGVKPAPAVVSSTEAANKVTDAAKTIAQATGSQVQTPSVTGSGTTTTTPTTTPTGAQVQTPSATGTATAEKAKSPAEQAILDQAKKDEEMWAGLFGSRIAKMDENLKNQLSDIQRSYGALRKEQEAINKNVEGAARQAGIRSGRSRYATEVQQGIEADVLAKSVQRLANIDSKMQAAMNDAISANEDKNFQLMVSSADRIQSIKKDARQAVLELQNAIRQEQQMAQQRMDADRNYALNVAKFESAEAKDQRDFIKDQFKELGSTAFDGLSEKDLAAYEASAGLPRGYMQSAINAAKAVETYERDVKMEELLGKERAEVRQQISQLITSGGIADMDNAALIGLSKQSGGLYSTTSLGAMRDAQLAKRAAQEAKDERAEERADVLNRISLRNLEREEDKWAVEKSEKQAAMGDADAGFLSEKQVQKLEQSPEYKNLKSLNSLDASLNRYYDLIDKYGTQIAVGAGKQALDAAYAEVVIKWKEAANLGALTGPDVAIIEKKIPKVTSGFTPSGVAQHLGRAIVSAGNFADVAKETLKREMENVGKDAFREYKGLIAKSPDFEGSLPVSEVAKAVSLEELAKDKGFDLEELRSAYTDAEIRETLLNEKKKTLNSTQSGNFFESVGSTSLGYGSPVWGPGLDVVAKKGTSIPAPVSGRVVESRNARGWGNTVVIEDDSGKRWRFSHLDSRGFNEGDTISSGQILGKVGNTGTVLKSEGGTPTPRELAAGRGAHIDITVYENGKPVTAKKVKQLLDNLG